MQDESRIEEIGSKGNVRKVTSSQEALSLLSKKIKIENKRRRIEDGVCTFQNRVIST